MKIQLNLVLLLLLATCTAHGQGTVLWNESINGELSRDFSSPTPLGPLQIGTNEVIGSTELEPNGSGWIGFYDYFTFVVPQSSSLSAVYLISDDQKIWTWVGTPDFSSQLGFVSNPTNGNLFPQMAISSIGPNTYGMYVENHDPQSVLTIANYRLDFFVQTIPEPGTACLFLLGAGVVGFLRWKKFR